MQARFEKTFSGWRDEARKFLAKRTPPNVIHWNDETPMLLQEEFVEKPDHLTLSTKLTVPPEFIELAEAVCYARDEDRWALLYRILYRLQFENKNLLSIFVDPDIMRANLLKKSVRRDIHKMHAFVRFKKTVINGEEIYCAWHKPEHLCVKPGTPFFARRFGDRKWSIFTPDESAHWDLKTLTFGPGIPQSDFKITDNWEEVWKTYYKSIFNPARLKIKMMKQEMDPKYWASMPEAALINDLIRSAPQRLQSMTKNQNRAADVDLALSLPELHKLASKCVACPLGALAHNVVFGEGPQNARIMIVGEQPGDNEDLQGKPFIGPAGEILNQALKAAGLNRKDLYLTNAVKHFKYKQEGKFRLHQKPSGSEMHACKPWLEAEIAQVKPDIIIALGATAATAILGRLPKIAAERGQVNTSLSIAPAVIVSWHPAAILRSFSSEESDSRKNELADDLALAKKFLKTL